MFGCNNDSLFPEKYTVKDHISNTKLQKGDRYKKHVPKSARKYKRNVLMSPGHPIILKSLN